MTGSAVLVVSPEGGENHWQPVPANGHISVRIAPHLVPMHRPFALGTQTVPPGCHVREHTHPENEEALHFIAGTGRAVVNGASHTVSPGVTIFVARGERHMFINDGAVDLHWLWLILPNGLETFFAEIGRPVVPGEPAPEPFPRPANVLEIERRTVFGPPISDDGPTT